MRHGGRETDALRNLQLSCESDRLVTNGPVPNDPKFWRAALRIEAKIAKRSEQEIDAFLFRQPTEIPDDGRRSVRAMRDAFFQRSRIVFEIESVRDQLD